MLFLLIALLAGNTKPPHVIDVYECTFEDIAQPNSLVKGIKNMQTDGTHLYIGEIQDPRILKLDHQGKLVRRIGKAGVSGGPEELGTTSGGMGIRRQSMVLQIGNKAHFFEKGAYSFYIDTPGFNPFRNMIHPCPEPVAFSQEFLVSPAFPNNVWLNP